MHAGWAAGTAGLGAAALFGLALTGCENREERLAREWRDKCLAKDYQACTYLGEAYEKGSGVPADRLKAAEHFKKACDGGNGMGCRLLSHAYATGAGVGKDAAKAADLLRLACENKDDEACRSACDAKDAVMCLRVGALASMGGKDPNRALMHYMKACEMGHPTGCRQAALMHRDGAGIPKNLDKAEELTKRANELKKTACAGASKPDFCTE